MNSTYSTRYHMSELTTIDTKTTLQLQHKTWKTHVHSTVTTYTYRGYSTWHHMSWGLYLGHKTTLQLGHNSKRMSSPQYVTTYTHKPLHAQVPKCSKQVHNHLHTPTHTSPCTPKCPSAPALKPQVSESQLATTHTNKTNYPARYKQMCRWWGQVEWGEVRWTW